MNNEGNRFKESCVTQGGMNEERNEYDKYKLIMIAVVMEDVLFE